MLEANILRGTRVRLTGLGKADLAGAARWQADAGYLRLYDARPAFPQTEEELAEYYEEQRKSRAAFTFAIRPIDGEDLLGVIELDGILWNQQVGWLSVGLGDRANWGRGYGSEAVQLALGFAFHELNLYRVQLTAFAYNERAVAMYERLGFQREGVFREFLHRDGQRYDMYLYGLLRREWEALHPGRG